MRTKPKSDGMLYVAAIGYVALSFFNLTEGNQLPPYFVSVALLALAAKTAAIEYLVSRIDQRDEEIESLEDELHGCLYNDE